MLAARKRLRNVQIAAADAVERIEDIELCECTHRRRTDRSKRRLARIADALTDILGEFIGVGDWLLAELVLTELERNIYRSRKRGDARMDVEHNAAGVSGEFAAAITETAQCLYDCAFLV